MYCLTAPNTSFSNCSQKMEVSLLIVFSTVSREDVKLCEYGALQRLREEGFSLLVLVRLLSWLLKHEWLPIHPPSTTGTASYAPCSCKTWSVPSLQLLQCMCLPQCPTSSAQVISLVPRNCVHGCFSRVQILKVWRPTPLITSSFPWHTFQMVLEQSALGIHLPINKGWISHNFQRTYFQQVPTVRHQNNFSANLLPWLCPLLQDVDARLGCGKEETLLKCSISAPEEIIVIFYI